MDTTQNNYQEQIDKIDEIYQQFLLKIEELKKKYDKDIEKILEEAADKKKMDEILNKIKNS